MPLILILIIVGLNYFLLSCENTSKTDKQTISTNPAVVEKGKSIFDLNCIACHHVKKDGIGPQLGGVTEEVSQEWLYNFIKNPQAIIQSGDERAQQLFTKYKTVMPSFGHLEDCDVENLIAFLHTQKAAPDADNNLDSAEITNPILSAITQSDLVVELKLVYQIPASSDNLPYTRITKLAPQPTSKKLFIVDLNGQLYAIQDNKPQLYLELDHYFPNFINKPGLGSGFGSFAFHPDWANNGLLYTTHTEKSGSAKADFVFDDSIKVGLQWVLSEWKTEHPKSKTFIGERRELLRVNMVSVAHGVQEVTFNSYAKPGEEDYGLLFIGIGDGTSVLAGITHLTQSKEKIWGTIVRIDPTGNNSRNGNYGIPKNNPWSKSNDQKILKEIYAYGFRNPHRINWTKAGQMIVTNIGEGHIESLYQVLPGRNYGWPIREGTFMVNPDNDINKVYPLPEDDGSYKISYPIAQYDHDEGNAISGGYEYTGTALPGLIGKYLFGDITSGRLFYINVHDIQLGSQAEIKEWQISLDGAITSLEELTKNKRVDMRLGRDAAGEIYITTKPDGKIYKCVQASKPVS